MEHIFNPCVQQTIQRSKLTHSLSFKDFACNLSQNTNKSENDQLTEVNDQYKPKKKKTKRYNVKYPASKFAPKNPFLQKVKAALINWNEGSNIKTQDAEQPQKGSIQEIKQHKDLVQKCSQEQEVSLAVQQVQETQKSKFDLSNLKKSGLMAKRSKK